MGGYFLKVPTIYLLSMSWANCFRTRNELTMYPLGILPFAPSVYTEDEEEMQMETGNGPMTRGDFAYGEEDMDLEIADAAGIVDSYYDW